MRCSIAIGFHGRSKFTSVLQNCRLRPSPPDSLHSSSVPDAAKAATAASFSGPDMLPSNSSGARPWRRSRSARWVMLSRWWTKTIFFSVGFCASSFSNASCLAPAATAW